MKGLPKVHQELTTSTFGHYYSSQPPLMMQIIATGLFWYVAKWFADAIMTERDSKHGATSDFSEMERSMEYY